MNYKLEKIFGKIKHLLSGQFIRNVGWMGVGELASRIFRLATTVTLARVFSQSDYGLLAIVFTTFEFANIFTLSGGIGGKIIQVDNASIKPMCDTAYWLSWIFCSGIFIGQCFLAFPISWFYGKPEIILPLCLQAFIYLLLPLFTINLAITERENRLKVKALCNVSQSLVSSLLTIVLVLQGLGIWAVVWAMLISYPVWIIITWYNTTWRPPLYFKLERWQEIVNFSKNRLGVQILAKFKGNVDYLVIGRFLGLEALGLYYFAFNAGFGISTNVINSFFSALFPHLCGARGDFEEMKKRYWNGLKVIYLSVGSLILLQSSLAPFYVPIVFGQNWTPAIPILIIICLSVLADAFWWGTSLLFDAMDKTHLTLYLEIIYTILFTLLILISVQWGIYGVAVGVLLAKILFIPIILPVLHKFINKYTVREHQI